MKRENFEAKAMINIPFLLHVTIWKHVFYIHSEEFEIHNASKVKNILMAYDIATWAQVS